MTAPFRARVECPNCGTHVNVEWPFLQWVRSQPELDSRSGLVRLDMDLVLHNYMTVADGIGDRRIQYVMVVEVKTNKAELTRAQSDTLSMFDQVLRNRRRNMHERPEDKVRQLREHAPLATAFSEMFQADVVLHLRGAHLLQLEGVGPCDGERMYWDRHLVDVDTLTKIMRAEVNADYPFRPLDLRRRYLPKSLEPLPLVEQLGFTGLGPWSQALPEGAWT